VAVLAALVGGGLAVRGQDGQADRRGATVERFQVSSRFLHRTLGQAGVRPAGAGDERRPLLVFLHGRNESGHGVDSNLNSEMFAALGRLGRRAPAIVFANGGGHSYWHDRRDGAWGRYVMEEVIPQAARRLHADPRSVAIGGISMGGFGAYDLARLHPGRFCAVGGHSSALWRTGGETAPGAFDDGEDFARHDVIGVARRDPRRFAGARLWLDSGDGDPFNPGMDALVAALRSAGLPLSVHRWPGEHESGYWKRHWGDYLRFYAASLRSCHPR
jgi:S-formylglutathione hydrolase FrmB